MEVIGITTRRDNTSAAGNREALRVFSQWKPPQGVDLKFLYFSADGTHSIGLLEIGSASDLARIAATFQDYVEFEWIPVVPAQDGAAIQGEVQAWVDRVKAG